MFLLRIAPPPGADSDTLRALGKYNFRGNLGPHLLNSSSGPPKVLGPMALPALMPIGSVRPLEEGGPQTRVCLGAPKGVNPPLILSVILRPTRWLASLQLARCFMISNQLGVPAGNFPAGM